MGELNVLPTDKSFKFSPDAGDPECICSRCGNKITEEEAPILRVFTTDEHDEFDANSEEYPYCDNCAAAMGFAKVPEMPWEEDPFDLVEERKCRVCGCTDMDCRHCIEKTGHPCQWVEANLCSACKQ